MTMEADENLEGFLGRLRTQVMRCGYTTAEIDQQLRDRCVLGSSGELQRRLVREAALKGTDLTLQDIRKTARAHQDVLDLTAQLGGVPAPAAMAADTVQALRLSQRPETGRPAGHPGACFRCGSTGHWQRDCPAAGAVPRARDKHRARDSHRPAGQARRVRLVAAEEEQTDGDGDAWLVNTVEASAAEPEMKTVMLAMVVDTGSPVSLVSAETARQLGLLQLLDPCDLRLTSFTGQVIPLRGEVLVSVSASDRSATRLRLVVTGFGPHRPLMGREWLQALDLMTSPARVCRVQPARTLEGVLERHSAVFNEELGRIPIKVGLRLKSDAKPVYRRARPVPFALQEAVDRELDRWEEQGVAEKVPPGSGWGTPLVVIPTQNGVRICADYRLTVNPQLEQTKYPMRTADELFSGVRGKRFAKLDCRSAYLQVELDENSKNATTVTTHRGDYRMNRLPYGISVCGALYQSVMDQITAGLPGTVSYMDDVLVWADTEEELLERLDATLTRMEENGIRLRREKCSFNVPEVTYLGWRLSADALRPLAGKTESILQAPDPVNQQALKSLIGTVSYYQRILPGLATVLTPLYALLKKGVKWQWTEQCAAAVKKVKTMLSSAPVLVRFDPDRPVRLVTDASETGLGAVLMQVTADGLEKPVQYASRTLTQTERKYAQVEKEAAAVSFGIRRFHQYLMGRRFTLVVDNRTLSRIVSPDRDLPTLAAARMQRYALQLAAYQYEVELRRSGDMRAADTLSRLPVSSPAEEREAAEEEAEYGGGGVMFVVQEQGPCLSARAIAAATRTDPVLGRVLAAVRSGWPGMMDAELTPYKHRADELSTDADCVLWGGRVVVPRALQDRVKQQLHEGHSGCTKMKQLARRFVWWPGLDAELEALARGCPACESKRAAPPHAERHPWEPAQGPWQRVHADFAGPLKGTWFLVMVDSFSKWAEMIPMKTTTSERTVAVMRTVFARLGLPLVLVTDNGPQFTSQEFAQFASSNGIRHVRVAPHHPSSNGMAERAVGSLKNSLKATLAADDSGGMELALARVLMAYRATPHASTGRTPAEVLLGRNIRTRLNLLVPTAEDALRDSAERQQTAAGGRARAFAVGADVWVRCYSGPQKLEVGVDRGVDAWLAWKQRWDDFVMLTGLDTATEAFQMARLRSCLGVMKKLCATPNLTLASAVNVCRAEEAAQRDAIAIVGEGVVAGTDFLETIGGHVNNLLDSAERPRAADGRPICTLGMLPARLQLAAFPATDDPASEAILREFADVFDGVIKVMSGEEFEIRLRPDATPLAISAPRRVPFALREPLLKELQKLEADDIITPMTEPTSWCAPIVVSEKKNGAGVRLCVDLSQLNNSVQRELYQSSTPLECVTSIASEEARFFAVFDALKGYHQCPLKPQSQPLTTFITPFGRYM
ncbi:uncharacterized protein K02A2.6-like [Amphibalanus amphitrite]|uniref:uncharacterized protein K02A2.6-like n=1 Tax=Amphibalanus amphitrite TaxID=1232801 RepID=UPI001C92866E|nr:uncharacterized protein K02A2.6-like [Amphibalanus amphitrite]